MAQLHKITPCLWFDREAEEAADFYVGIFPNSRIDRIARYTEVGREFHGREPGSVMTVAFELDGHAFTALNGGPIFKFNEAVSLQIYVEDQKELDYFWNKLTAGGDPAAQVCGWLKDKYGLSWQVVPKPLMNMWKDSKSPGMKRAFAAMMDMKKLDIAKLKAAFKGK